MVYEFDVVRAQTWANRYHPCTEGGSAMPRAQEKRRSGLVENDAVDVPSLPRKRA